MTECILIVIWLTLLAIHGKLENILNKSSTSEWQELCKIKKELENISYNTSSHYELYFRNNKRKNEFDY